MGMGEFKSFDVATGHAQTTPSTILYALSFDLEEHWLWQCCPIYPVVCV